MAVTLLPFDNKSELQVVLDLSQMGDLYVNLTPKNDRKRASAPAIPSRSTSASG